MTGDEQPNPPAPMVARDLCNPRHGEHPFQGYVADAHQALAALWSCPRLVVRPAPFTVVGDAGGRHRVARHGALLETVPALLADLAVDPPEDLLLVCPGPVAGADFAGPRHELLLLRLTTAPAGTPELGRMVQRLTDCLLPGIRYRLLPEAAPHTRESMAVEGQRDGRWQRLGRCGQLSGDSLQAAGFSPDGHAALMASVALERLHELRSGSEVVAEEDVKAAVHG